MANKPDNIKTIATNKKAFHDYFVEETMEAGIALAGTGSSQSGRRGQPKDVVFD